MTMTKVLNKQCAQKRLLSAGDVLSNIAFNIAQLGSANTSTLNAARLEWDAARSALRQTQIDEGYCEKIAHALLLVDVHLARWQKLTVRSRREVLRDLREKMHQLGDWRGSADLEQAYKTVISILKAAEK